MMIFVVNYVYLIHILSLNSSGNGTPNRKPTVRSQQKVKRLKVHFSGGVLFEKKMNNEDS